ncbi:MAG: helix-turn-helix transcriptional regulator [Bdellovibrionales bacterium]|nr:helix-turn-helix transcriptional regulator [Bdellovibrionales bacterium]
MKNEAFSSRLKRLREEKGLKVKDMASELGISVSTCSSPSAARLVLRKVALK